MERRRPAYALHMTRDRVWPIIVVALLVYEAIWWGVWLVYPPGIWFFAP